MPTYTVRPADEQARFLGKVADELRCSVEELLLASSCIAIEQLLEGDPGLSGCCLREGLRSFVDQERIPVGDPTNLNDWAEMGMKEVGARKNRR